MHIWDVRPLFNALNVPGTTIDRKKIETPLFTVNAHRTEGFAMDWGGLLGGGASGHSGHLRLLTGDMHSKIFLTTSNNTGFTTHATPFESHTSSVEDLQWSPTEPTVFASCSADRSIRIWDVRIKSHRSALTVDAAHEQDVNVISWNRGTQFLLLSGGDDGALNVWDMRSFKPNQTPSPVAHFDWHRAPISSVEWHPEEDSIFAASGRDDQVTLWDLGVERDDEEDDDRPPQDDVLAVDAHEDAGVDERDDAERGAGVERRRQRLEGAKRRGDGEEEREDGQKAEQRGELGAADELGKPGAGAEAIIA